ncbi:asparagine synthetase B [Methanopyrus sp. SNP6]|uniref:asparagine synthetase B family protein n=1 Tax=Methanopyrus sp. SNP6 TaxID=1937005 RepID=UPI0011E5EA84|nr:asparagine synthetase B [Methanopyrus sp. SNP6]
MCGIACTVGGDVAEMVAAIKHRGPDGRGFASVSDGDVEFSEESPSEGDVVLGHVRLWVRGEPSAIQPIVGEDRAVAVNGEIYNYRRFVEDAPSDSWAVFEVVRSVRDAAAALRILRGEYTFVAAFVDGTVVAARDPVGVRPLYYSVSAEGGTAVASERKALWAAGFRDVRRVPPGALLVLRDGRVELRNVVDVPKPRPGKSSWKDLLKVLQRSVRERVMETERVGVVLSGGVDSSTVARLASEHVDVRCYVAGFEGSDDVEVAERLCDEMGWSFVPVSLEDGFERYVVSTVYAVETWNPMKVEVGIPILACAGAASDDGIRVVLSGQGADELLGGYHRHLRYCGDWDRFSWELWKDVASIHAVNLERDDKAAMYSSVELRVPYLDLDVVRVGLDIDPRENVSGPEDDLRKRALRRVAAELGLPEFVVERRKRATQYGSLTSKMLDKLVRELGIKRAVAKRLGYRSHKELFLRLVGKYLGFPWKAPSVEDVEKECARLGVDPEVSDFLEERVLTFDSCLKGG